ncbi:MAG: hypothetical protein NTV40_01435 [Solirubrobacterales bacterium]|nr:hypothetical protein [Solirubrobacterales bacterium]
MPSCRLLAVFLAAATTALCLPAVSTAATTTTVTGTIKAAGAKTQGLRVMALPTSGPAVTTRPKGNGSFTLRIASAKVNGLSLQLISADGSYFGPVLLYAKGATGSTRLGKITAKTVSLGSMSMAKGYAKLTRFLAAKSVLTTGTGAVKLSKGAPIGAARLGYVKASAKAKTSQNKQCGPGELSDGKGGCKSGGGGGGGGGGDKVDAPGGKCSTADSLGSASGGDCGSDGIPNVVDVDDNGNLSLDSVDKVSADTTAKLNLFFGLRPHFANQINVYSGATRASINAYLGADSEETGLSMGFYLAQQYLDKTKQPAFANVWLTCSSGQPWCAPGTGTASISGMADTPPLRAGGQRFEQIAWNSFFGASCNSSSCAALTTTDPNSLVRFTRSGAKPGDLPSWIGAVRPASDDTLAKVVPGDVLMINSRSASGQVTSQPTTISPYFVTSPGIASYGPADGSLASVDYPLTPATPGTNSSNPVVVDASGKLKLRFWRPQRFGLPGESAEFYDLGGLRWGVSIESYTDSSTGQYHQGGLAACPTTDLVGVTANAVSNDKVQFTDSSALDVATDAAQMGSRVIGFTVDVKSCLAAAGFPTSSGTGTRIALLAQGAALPGGANETGMDLEVALP